MHVHMLPSIVYHPQMMSICHHFICFMHFTPLIRDQNEGIAEIILAKKTKFSIFSSYISHYDEKLNYLEHIQSTVRDIWCFCLHWLTTLTEPNLFLLLGISINLPLSLSVFWVCFVLYYYYTQMCLSCVFIYSDGMYLNIYLCTVACVLYHSYQMQRLWKSSYCRSLCASYNTACC